VISTVRDHYFIYHIFTGNHDRRLTVSVITFPLRACGTSVSKFASFHLFWLAWSKAEFLAPVARYTPLGTPFFRNFAMKALAGLLPVTVLQGQGW